MRQWIVAAIVTCLAMAGLFVIVSNATTTTYVSTESESAARSGGATSITDTTASAGNAIKFTAPATLTGYGMSVPSIMAQPIAVQDAWLDDMKSLGINWMRIDIGWISVQSTRDGAYYWTAYDRIVAAAKARGIKTLGLIGYPAQWARLPECATNKLCRPADINEYATFAAAVASHFGSDMPVVEIWNEPNIFFWAPRIEPDVYTAMLKASYTAIKAVSPNTFVITGGLAPAHTSGTTSMAPMDFVNAMYANGAKDHFDALGHHPYSYPAPPSEVKSWSGWSQMTQTSPSLYSIMQANGDGAKKIWMTETGAPSNGPGEVATCTDFAYTRNPDHVDECLQARMISEEITLSKNQSWAGVPFIYTYKDKGTSTTDRENFFGIIRADGSQKPAYNALKNAIAQ